MKIQSLEQESEKEGISKMLIKINNSCVINADNIVWININNEKMTIKLTDGTEHEAEANLLNKLLEIINK